MGVRIIPRLDIKGPNLVKGIQFEGLRVLGKPEQFTRYYYEGGADELIYQDAVASLFGRNSLLGMIERIARHTFIPLTVGGGLRTLDDIRAALRAGADKVSINTAAVARPELIREAAHRFGSSTIVVSIEAIRHPDGRYEAYTDFGRESTGVDAIAWAKQAVELGAGELLVTCINQEGSGKGFDLELTRAIAEAVPVPVIAAGGAGRVEHVAEVIQQGRADAVCCASLFHYEAVRHFRIREDEFREEGNIEFLRKGGTSFSRISPATIAELKRHLAECGIEVRPWEAAAA